MENMELFDMSRVDATLEALMQFRTQGVDLSNFTMPEGIAFNAVIGMQCDQTVC